MRRTSKNRYYNPNPLKKETSDCVIRALCALTSEPWDDIYKELCEIGFEIKEMPNSKGTYETYLKKHGYIRVPISNKKGTKRPTVNEMAKKSKDGMNYLCDIANHLVTVSEGYILDLWDSGEKCLYAYWTKAE